MSPILGIYASSIQPSLNASSFESIATATPSGATVTFSSIPSTYTHLQIRSINSTNRTSTNDWIKYTFNGDNGTNYANHFVQGTNGSASAGTDSPSQNYAQLYRTAAVNSLTNSFGVFVMDILDYANTSKYKTARTLLGFENDALGVDSVVLNSGLWLSTAAITSITFAPRFGTTFVAGSHFALYGIKGA
jgi:hypothetical protein